MQDPLSDQPLRFRLKDLMLVTGILGYLCGLISFGVTGLGWRVIVHLGKGIGMLGPEITAAWPFAFFGSLAMLVVVSLSENSGRSPKLFLLLNLAVVLVSCCFPLITLDHGINISGMSLAASFAIGAIPLSVAWLVHRWILEFPLTPVVSRTFYTLMFLDLMAIGSVLGMCVFASY